MDCKQEVADYQEDGGLMASGSRVYGFTLLMRVCTVIYMLVFIIDCTTHSHAQLSGLWPQLGCPSYWYLCPSSSISRK